MSTVGSMSTQDPLQQLYALNMVNKMSPYMGQTASALSQMGQEAINTYQGIPDWKRYISESYEQPALYDMNKQIGNLAHSKELFSSAYQNRKAGLMGATNAGLNASIGNELMTERQGQMSGFQQGLQRQAAALQQFQQAMAQPLSYQGQENTISARGLFDEIGRMM